MIIRKNERGFAVLEALGIFVVLLVIVTTGYYIYHRHKEDQSQKGNVPSFSFGRTEQVNVPPSATSDTPLGSTVSANYFILRVTKVETNVKNVGIAPQKGMQFIKVFLSVQNTDQQTCTISEADFYYLTTTGKHIQDSTNYPGLNANSADGDLDDVLNPRQTDSSSHLIFQVPIGDKGKLIWYANTNNQIDINVPLPNSSSTYIFGIFDLY
jgi:hypothetical protein